MKLMHRRVFLAVTMLLTGEALCAGDTTTLAQQASDGEKPTLKRSEVKPLVNQLVKNVSALSGRELSSEEKSELENAILFKMEAQGTYAFIDP